MKGAPMARKQQIAERIARLTKDDDGNDLPVERQSELVAELVKANTATQLKDRLSAMTDPVPEATEPPEAAAEPGTAVATTVDAQVEMLDRNRLELLRRTLAADLTDDQFAIYAAQCNLRRLDPFANQIHAVVRQGKLCVQTGIDGFRVIADRTGNYAGSSDPVYEGEVQFGTGQNTGVAPMRATVTISKIVQGQVFEVTRHAYWDEYYPGNGSDGFMWRKMPHVMLAKCAEAQALRAAFPADLSGLYADEEMMQASAVDAASSVRDAQAPTHDEATEVERWRQGLRDVIEAADESLVADLKSRWPKIEPQLPKLDAITSMRDMRRAVAVAKSALRVREIHPVDALPTEPATDKPPEPVQDRDPREDTIDVDSTEHTDVPSPPPEPPQSGAGDAAPTPPASEPAPDEEVCAVGDGGFTDETGPPVYSEDGKPYHTECAPFMED